MRYWETRSGALFLVPTFIVFACLAGSILTLAYQSLYAGPFFNPLARMVGAKNFTTVMSSGDFWNSIVLSIWYGVASAIGQVALGLTNAIALIQTRGKLRSIVVSIILIPFFMPAALTVMLVKFIFDTQNGVANFNLIQPFSPENLVITSILLSIWTFSPLVTIVFFERLSKIPSGLLLQAHLDGFGLWSKFKLVVLPVLLPSIVALLVLRALLMFSKFDILYFVGGESAAYQYVESVPLYIYRAAYSQGLLGFAGAVSVILTVASISIAIMAIKARRKKVKTPRNFKYSFMANNLFQIRIMDLVFLSVPRLVLILTAFSVVVPIAYMVLMSFSNDPLVLNRGFSITNFTSLFTDYYFLSSLSISLISVLTVVIVVLFCSSTAAFAWDTYRLKFRDQLTALVFSLYIVPIIVIVYGFNSLFLRIDFALPNLVGVMLGMASYLIALGISVFLAFGSDREIPTPLSASSEGLGPFTYFLRVYIPNRRGAILVVTSLVAAAVWTDYLFFRVIGNGEALSAIVKFQEIISAAVLPWGAVMAGGTILLIPGFVLATVLGKQILYISE